MNAIIRRRPFQRALFLFAALVSTGGCATTRSEGISFTRKDPGKIAQVAPGALYRSAQPNLRMLQQARADYGIRTVVNLRGGDPDPEVGGGRNEREFCESQGVRYVHLPADDIYRDIFPSKEHPERSTPAFVEEFLRIVQDPAHRPVLIHCAGGKHRTGFLTAVYRIVVDQWSLSDTYAELFSYGVESGDFRDHPHIWRYFEYLAQSRESAEPVALRSE